MGRRKHRRRYNKSNNPLNNQNNNTNNYDFSPGELKQVEEYLRKYKEYCCCNLSSKTATSSNDGNRDDSYPIGNNNILFPSFKKKNPVETTTSTTSQKYLMLPSTLTKNQRKDIHGICEELGLFHGSIDIIIEEEEEESYSKSHHTIDNDVLTTEINSSVNDDKTQKKQPTTTTTTSSNKTTNPNKSNDALKLRRRRACVVSVDSDGFDELYKSKKLSRPSGFPVSFRSIRPWYFQQGSFSSSDHDNKAGDECSKIISQKKKPNKYSHQFWREDPIVVERNKSMSKVIQKLIDYPTECLRRHSDVFDIGALHDIDLSHCEGISEDYPFFLVDSVEKLQLCVKEIRSSNTSELGFDLEMYNQSKQSVITCLIQLATPTKDYVIDVFAPEVWSAVGTYLGPIFEDGKIVKIGHTIGCMDVPSLHRDFGIFIVNAFDACEAAMLLKLKKVGLASICEYYNLPRIDHYKKLKESYQRTDWRKRPMTDNMLTYGRYDVHYLIPLRRLLIRDLYYYYSSPVTSSYNHITSLKNTDLIDEVYNEEELTFLSTSEEDLNNASLLVENTSKALDSVQVSVATRDTPKNDNPVSEASDEGMIRHRFEKQEITLTIENLFLQEGIMKVFSRSQFRCMSFWKYSVEKYSKNSKVEYYMKKKNWDNDTSELFEMLLDWRQSVAAAEEMNPLFVCHVGLLASIAQQMPTDKDMLKCLNFFLPEILDGNDVYLDEIFTVVKGFIEMRQRRLLLAEEAAAKQCWKRNMQLMMGATLFGLIVVGSSWKKRSR